MFARVTTVVFEGIEARAVDVQVQISSGMPAFTIVGLPDKAVAESRERVRGALDAIGLALPPKRITVNLAPADLPKEGSHYDLPIALGLMAAIGAIPPDALNGYAVLGELGLDGSLAPVAGVLPAAIGANGRGEGLICPAGCGPEAAWASPEMDIIAAGSLIQLANHFKKTQVLARPAPKVREERARRERQQEDEDDYAVRINRTLIYPVQWGRAEDLAETLQPLLEASYGPGVRVIPHVATNHLLIYLPPREVLDSPGGGRLPATGGTR